MKRPVALIAVAAAVRGAVSLPAGRQQELQLEQPVAAPTGGGRLRRPPRRSGSTEPAGNGPRGRQRPHALPVREGQEPARAPARAAARPQWPPLTTTGKPNAGSGVDAAMLSATKRPDGKSQVVYAGHPLYYYAGDTKAGDTNGQGLDAVRRRVVRGLGHRQQGGEEQRLRRWWAHAGRLAATDRRRCRSADGNSSHVMPVSRRPLPQRTSMARGRAGASCGTS